MRSILVLSAILGIAMAAELCAQTPIAVSVRVADVPAGIRAPEDPKRLEKTRGVQVLSAPVVTTRSGTSAQIAITQTTPTPGARTENIGLTIEIKPTIIATGEIAFSGVAIDRSVLGKIEGKGVRAVEFVARELHFSGVAKHGQTVLLQSDANVSLGGGERKAQLALYLTFEKKPLPPARKEPAPKKNSGSSKPRKR